MVKKGLIAFANDGGLGAQTRRLAHFLKPDIIMVVNSSGFSKNTTQHYEWYQDFNYFIVDGFPNNDHCKKFLQNLTHVFCVENPYNFGLVYWGQLQGTKIYCQTNYEFCDNLDKPWLPTPDKFLMPSHWMLEEMKQLYGDKVQYLPPPMTAEEFKEPRETNLKRRGKRKFLHVLGTPATADRNGVLDLIDAVPLTKSDFELVIRTQHPLSMDVYLDDPRVQYEQGNLGKNSDLYKDFDALILPRRWGGLCLTMNEALMSAMPVIMPDISPNSQVLPQEWLVPAQLKGRFLARTPIEFHSVDHQKLADKMDELATMSDEKFNELRLRAYKLALEKFSFEALEEEYSKLFDDR